MELDLALLADAANISRENKLNILGEFNVFRATAPIVMPPCVLVLRVVGHASEIGSAHRLGVRLRNEDGNLLWSSPDLGITLPEPEIEGLPVRCQVLAPLTGLPIPGPGTFEFEVVLDGEPARTRDGNLAKGAEFHVVVRSAPPAQG
jgi:Family of unknown function (DUF6941)